MLGAAIPGLEIVAYDGPEPVEDGATFEENALIKARAAAAHTGLPALADDSGICVDVMGGAPGIFSARWAGSHGDATANLRLLLDQLADVPDAHRGAHFTATLALLAPGGEPTVVQGIWPGRIARGAARRQRARLRPDLRPGGPRRHGSRAVVGGEERREPPREGVGGDRARTSRARDSGVRGATRPAAENGTHSQLAAASGGGANFYLP